MGALRIMLSRYWLLFLLRLLNIAIAAACIVVALWQWDYVSVRLDPEVPFPLATTFIRPVIAKSFDRYLLSAILLPSILVSTMTLLLPNLDKIRALLRGYPAPSSSAKPSQKDGEAHKQVANDSDWAHFAGHAPYYLSITTSPLAICLAWVTDC